MPLQPGLIPPTPENTVHVARAAFPDGNPDLQLRDELGTIFHDAYFAENEGVWTHGDLIEFDADGQARIHGRSDGVLNIQGVRIGPSVLMAAYSYVIGGDHDFSDSSKAVLDQSRTSAGEQQHRIRLSVR